MYLHAKSEYGQGFALDWIDFHDELVRIQNHGLLPNENGGHY